MRSAEWDPPSRSRTAAFMTRSYSIDDSQLMPPKIPMHFTSWLLAAPRLASRRLLRARLVQDQRHVAAPDRSAVKVFPETGERPHRHQPVDPASDPVEQLLVGHLDVGREQDEVVARAGGVVAVAHGEHPQPPPDVRRRAVQAAERLAALSQQRSDEVVDD